MGGWVGGGWVGWVGWVGGWVGWGGFGRFSLPFARLRGTPLVIATACRSSHRTHATAPADRDRAPRWLPRALRGRLTARSTSHPRADCCYARQVRQRSSSSRGSNARRPSSPPSSTTRRPLLSPVLGRAAAARCRVGGALPMTNIRLTVKHGCSHAQPCSGASLGSPLPPRCRGRRALFDLGYYLASGGRRRRCRGGGELPVANARLTVQDGGSRPRPCSGVPL